MFESTGGDVGLWLKNLLGGGSSASSMPAVGTETLTPQWQGYQAGALGQQAPTGTAPDSAYATGYQAGLQPWSAPTTTGTGAGVGGLAGALKGAAGQVAGQQQQQQVAKAQAPGPTQSQIGRPSHAENLSNLLNQLNQWRSAYMSPQAINPASATSNTQQRQPGLLGM